MQNAQVKYLLKTIKETARTIHPFFFNLSVHLPTFLHVKNNSFASQQINKLLSSDLPTYNYKVLPTFPYFAYLTQQNNNQVPDAKAEH